MIGNELGPYRVLGELGTGGMGSVYKAELSGPVAHLEPGSVVALKVLHPHMVSAEGVFERFQREAQIGMRIVHENVVRTFDVGKWEGDSGPLHYLAMEFVEGQTLRDLLDELGTIPEQLCRHIGGEVARALTELHKHSVVHRDLKPENVLITKDEVVKVMDLGVARLAEEAVKLSQTGQFIGSLVYAAPEQFMGVGDIDGRTDLYSLGLVLYELSTAQNPFDAEDIGSIIERKLREESPEMPAVLRPASEFNPQLSPFFEQVTAALVRKEREERIATAGDLLQILDESENSAWWLERAHAIRTETKRPLRRIRIPRDTALYGRDKELAQLRGMFESACSGEGQVLLLEGEAGIGKTRLIDEFVGQLEAGGTEVNFLFGGYPPSGAATADGAFSTAYREHFDAAGLEESLGGYLRDTPVLVPALAALLRGEPTPDGAEPLTRSSMQTVFVHLTAALASELPTIVVIDDLHFAPEEGRALFAALAMAASNKRLLLVGNMRRGMSEDWVHGLTQQSHVNRISLPRLGRDELVRLLQDSFGSPTLAEQLADRIGTKSDGNPFFIFELIRDLREANLIEAVGSGTWVSTRVLRDLRVPSTVMDLIAARMSGMSEEDREILDVAACCGHEFDPGLVAEAVGIRRIPFLRTLGRIERERKLVRSAGRKYVFDHHQVQEVIYTGLPEPLRCEYHGVIAETLEEREEAKDVEPAQLDGDVAIALAEHFVKGARVKEGKRYLDAAVRHLQANYLGERAVDLLQAALTDEKAIRGAERVEVLQKLSQVLDVLGRREEEIATLDEALAIAEGVGDAALHSSVLRNIGWQMIRAARLDEGEKTLREALRLAIEAGDRLLESQANANLAVVLQNQGRHTEAASKFERQIELARETGYRLGESRGIMNLAINYAIQGELEQAIDLMKQRLAISREIGDRRGESLSLTNLAHAHQDIGQPVEARDYAQRAVAMAREIGDRWAEAGAALNLGTILLDLGEIDESRGFLEHSLALAKESGYRAARGDTLLALGRLEAEAERADAAAHYFDDALELARKLDAPSKVVLAAAYRATLPGGDIGIAEETRTRLEERLGSRDRMEARFVLWKATRQPDHLKEARRLLDSMCDAVPEQRRKAMMERVSLFRGIRKAWEERDEGADAAPPA